MMTILWILLISGLCLLKRNALYTLYILLVIGIPSNENLYSMIGLKIGRISITDLLLILLFVISIIELIKRKIFRVYKFDIFVIAFIVILLFSAAIGIKNQNMYLKSELIIYLRMVIIYFVYRINILIYKNYKMYLREILNASIVYSIFCIIIYFNKDVILPKIYGDNLLQWWGTSRVAFSNTTIYIFWPILLNSKIESSRVKRTIIFCLVFFSIFITQSRTLIAAFILVILAQYLSKVFNKKRFYIFVSIMIISSSVLVTCILNFNKIQQVMNNSKFEVVQRFSKLFVNNYGDDDSRIITNNIYKNELMDNKGIGVGLGEEMILFDYNYKPASSGIFIDNAILTIIYKMGLIVLIPIFCMILSLFLNIINKCKFNNKIKFDIIFISICFIIISGAINAQIIYSLPVNTFVIINGLILRNKLGF